MKKGFTLIEIIGVIVLLGVIALFSIPALTQTISDSAEKQYEEYVKNIKIAAESYFHNETDGTIDGEYFITVGTLYEDGSLKKQTNPKTEKETPGFATITITKNEDNTENYELSEKDLTVDKYKQGLILWYDGYILPEDNIWKDLTDNSEAVLDNYYYDYNGIRLGSLDISGISTNSSYTLELTFLYNTYGYLIDDILLSSNQIIISDLSISANPKEKYTLTIVMDGTRRTIYLNGALVTTDNGLTSLDDMKIENFDGKIYSIRVYDKVLSYSDVYENYMVDKYRFGV